MDKETEEKRQRFIQEMAENGGDYKAAAKKAGYTQSYAEKLRRTVRDQIRAATTKGFGDALPKAVRTIVDLMDSKNESIRLKAAFGVADRNGLEGVVGIKTNDARQLTDEELDARIAKYQQERRQGEQFQWDDGKDKQPDRRADQKAVERLKRVQ